MNIGDVFLNPGKGFYRIRKVVDGVFWMSGPCTFYSDTHTRLGCEPFSGDFVSGLVPVTVLDQLEGVEEVAGIGWRICK